MRVRWLVARPVAVGTRGTAFVLTAVVAIGAAAVALLAALAAAPASASPSHLSVNTLYRTSLATTKSWNVHYVSSSTQSKMTLEESGNAGPASGTQFIHLGKANALTDSATIDVIGGTSYLKGNAAALEALAGFSAVPGHRGRRAVDPVLDRQQCLLLHRGGRALHRPVH